jgi:hypothetical protein
LRRGAGRRRISVILYFHSDGGGETQRTIVGDLAENVAKRIVLLTDEF